MKAGKMFETVLRINFEPCCDKTKDSPKRIQKEKNVHKTKESNSPSGNIFGVFAVASAVRVSDLEDGSDGASVLAGNSLQADVVLAAVLRVGVTAERSSVGHFSGGGARETVRYFWEIPERVT